VSAAILQEILASTRKEVEQRKHAQAAEERPGGEQTAAGEQAARTRARSFRDALNGPEIAVIAEFKRRSPSAGRLREDTDLDEIVSAYERGGAAALSILTEGPHFEGGLDDLRRARDVCALPLLRKDFILDPFQLHEAATARADAVLLIVAALDRATLQSLHTTAADLGLDVLVEVHDLSELHTALEIGAELIGINNRDLRDFSVDVGRTSQLMAQMPAGVTVVSESGIARAAQLRNLQQEGIHAVLVGESLMRAPDPEKALRELRNF
jgi:indole-3-glycerol phosphate synthase